MKMRNRKRKSLGLIILLFMSFFLAHNLCIPRAGAEEKDTFSATLTDFEGEVSIQKPGEDIWLPVEKEMPVEESDRIKTGVDAFAEVLVDDGSLLRLEENSEMVLSELSADFKTRRIESKVFLQIGRLLSKISRFVDGRSRFQVQTPTMVAGVRGTEFIVETLDGQTTEVGVVQGEVYAGGIDAQGNLMKASVVPVLQGNQTLVRRYGRPLRPFAFRGRMLLHRKRMMLHRKRAIERRRHLRQIRARRWRVRERTLRRWKQLRQNRGRQYRRRPGSPPGGPRPPARRPGHPPPRRRPGLPPPRR